MSLRRPIAALAGACAAGLLAACRDTTAPTPRDARVEFMRVVDTLGVGDSVRLEASVGAPSDPHWGATERWASRSPGVVTVDSLGNARGVATGDAWLVVSGVSGRRVVASDSVRVHVTPESRSLRLALSRDSAIVTDTLTATTSLDARYGPAPTTASLRFASSDTLVARVDSLTGKVRVMGDGDVTISATDGSRTALATLRAWLRTIETGDVRLRQISIGWGFGCGLDAAGAAYCWGANNLGQLGRGTRSTGNDMLPFGPVRTSTPFTAISAGRGGACGLTQGGGVECWGTRTLTGLSQQLTLDQRTLPVAVTFPAGAGRIVRIDVGTRGPLCAIDEAGANYCFGDNMYNGIGGNSRPGDPFLVATVRDLRPVPGLPAGGVQSIGTGEMHGCGTTTVGALWCWGSGDSWGASAGSTDAARVEGVPAFRDAIGGFQSTCALAADGTPWCSGHFESGSVSAFHPLTRPAGAPPLVRLEGGAEYACGLAANGEATCWSHQSPLIAPYEFFLRQPVPLSRRERFVDVGANLSGMCGVTAEGMVRCLMFLVRFQ